MKRIIIIGGGPGGYVAAIRAAQLKAEVHIVEEEKLGGTCLNIGCIPTKALLHSAFFYKHAKENSIPGVTTKDVVLDWSAVQKHKQSVTDTLVGGVNGLLMANKVKIHKGKAVIKSSKIVEVNGKALPEADAIIIASGSLPVKLNFPGADNPKVIDSTAALSLETPPKSICIVGGGVIGVEFASLFNSVGAKVTIVEMLPEILPPMDKDVATLMNKKLTTSGVDILTNSKLTDVKKGKDGNVIAGFEVANKKQEVETEYVLVAVGRKPNTENLGLEALKIKTDRGAIVVDGNFETNVKGIFAIGDCNAKMMLAHAASAQGEAAVEYITEGKFDYADIIPSCVYTEPELAGVGITEEQAKQANLNYSVGRFELAGNGKAMISGDSSGFVKIIADTESGEVLGVHMVGPHVTDMIGEAAVVMRMEGLTEDIIRTIHAHPTVSESVNEAARAVFGNAIHWPPGN